jgi:hypothetical protein
MMLEAVIEPTYEELKKAPRQERSVGEWWAEG